MAPRRPPQTREGKQKCIGKGRGNSSIIIDADRETRDAFGKTLRRVRGGDGRTNGGRGRAGKQEKGQV